MKVFLSLAAFLINTRLPVAEFYNEMACRFAIAMMALFVTANAARHDTILSDAILSDDLCPCVSLSAGMVSVSKCGTWLLIGFPLGHQQRVMAADCVQRSHV